MKELKVNPAFIPYKLVPGDEMLRGFPFNWNVSKALKWIPENLGEIELSVVKIGLLGSGADSAKLGEDFLPQADLTKPLIIVRMCLKFF